MSNERERLLLAFIQHREALLNYLTRKFGNLALAEDITQETWVRLASRVVDGSHVSNPKAYLFRIADNLMRDHYRHLGLGIEVETCDEQVNQISDSGVDPLQSAHCLGELQRLLAVIEQLPPRCREVFILCRVDGLSHAQIAERLGISKATVVSQMVKALSRLEQVMP